MKYSPSLTLFPAGIFVTKILFLHYTNSRCLLKEIETTHQIVFIGFTDGDTVTINDTGVFFQCIYFFELNDV